MSIGPRDKPYPLIAHVDSTTNKPVKIAEASAIFVSSVSATTVSATNYLNLPGAGTANEAFSVVFEAKNNSNTTTIPKGTPVAIVGANGANILIAPLSSVNTSVPQAVGFQNHVAGLTQVEFSANAIGHVITDGLLAGFDGPADQLNTNNFNPGDVLFVSSNGKLTNVKPPAPYEAQSVGIVTKKNSNNGEIYVKIETPTEINDIVGFNLSSPLVNGDLITYDLTTSTFSNKQTINISGAGYFGSVSANTVSSPTIYTQTLENNITNSRVSINPTNLQGAWIYGDTRIQAGNLNFNGRTFITELATGIVNVASAIQTSGLSIYQPSSTSAIAVDVSSLWNTPNLVTLFRINASSLNSGTNSRLLDIQHNSASKFAIYKSGAVYFTPDSGSVVNLADNRAFTFGSNPGVAIQTGLGNDGLNLFSGAGVYWSSGSAYSNTRDTYLTRSGVGIISATSSIIAASALIAPTVSATTLLAPTLSATTLRGGILITNSINDTTQGALISMQDSTFSIKVTPDPLQGNGFIGFNGTVSGPTARFVSLSSTGLTVSQPSSITTPLADLATTWNTAGTPTAIRLNVTDTSSNANSLLMDLQVGVSSKFNVDKSGNITITQGSNKANLTPFLLGLAGTYLQRDAADILAMRNGNVAQNYRLYNTYTDANNYERATIDWKTSSNVLRIGTEASGTGVGRDLQLIVSSVPIISIANSGTVSAISTLRTATSSTSTNAYAFKFTSDVNGTPTDIRIWKGKMIFDRNDVSQPLINFRDPGGPESDGFSGDGIGKPTGNGFVGLWAGHNCLFYLNGVGSNRYAVLNSNVSFAWTTQTNPTSVTNLYDTQLVRSSSGVVGILSSLSATLDVSAGRAIYASSVSATNYYNTSGLLPTTLQRLYDVSSAALPSEGYILVYQNSKWTALPAVINGGTASSNFGV